MAGIARSDLGDLWEEDLARRDEHDAQLWLERAGHSEPGAAGVEVSWTPGWDCLDAPGWDCLDADNRETILTAATRAPGGIAARLDGPRVDLSRRRPSQVESNNPSSI